MKLDSENLIVIIYLTKRVCYHVSMDISSDVDKHLNITQDQILNFVLALKTNNTSQQSLAPSQLWLLCLMQTMMIPITQLII